MGTLAHPESKPLGEMNTTPLIDVLLVLLIMFIMAVPVATNVVPIDLPRPGKDQHALPIRPENALSVTPQGTITWNGAPTSEAELAATLASLVQLAPEPLVKFEPAPGAPYGQSARVIRIVKFSGLASFAFVGTERFADFDKAAPAHGN